MKNTPNEFDEYLRQGEPQKRERAEAWGVAIGLQAVDGLTPSQYLVENAKRPIIALVNRILALKQSPTPTSQNWKLDWLNL